MSLLSDNQRLLDLVRQQRIELHRAGLITDEEYADLCALGSTSVGRLGDYQDALRQWQNNQLDSLNALARVQFPNADGPMIENIVEAWLPYFTKKS